MLKTYAGKIVTFIRQTSPYSVETKCMFAGATGGQGDTGATGASGPSNIVHDVPTPLCQGPRGDVHTSSLITANTPVVQKTFSVGKRIHSS